MKDWGKGLLLAVLVALAGALQQMLQTQGFDFQTWDLALIGNAMLLAFTGYIGKNFISDSNGTPFGSAK